MDMQIDNYLDYSQIDDKQMNIQGQKGKGKIKNIIELKYKEMKGSKKIQR